MVVFSDDGFMMGGLVALEHRLFFRCVSQCFRPRIAASHSLGVIESLLYSKSYGNGDDGVAFFLVL